VIIHTRGARRPRSTPREPRVQGATMGNRTKLGILAMGLMCVVLASTPGAAQNPVGNDKAPPAAAAQATPATPPSAIHRLGTAKWRHGSRILCLSYSPNGRILAAGGGDDPIRLWDTDSGTELRSLPEPWVNALAWSREGSVLITAGAFKTIRLWAAATGQEIGQIKAHTTAVKSLAISPSGTLLASGGQDGSLYLWELIFR